MRLLDINDCPDHLLESTSLTEEEYQQLLESRALEKINNTTGKIIDEYEDEAITTPQELKESLQILKTHLKPKNSKTLNKIIRLNALAINRNTGLFFFF
ncbi:MULTISPECIES: hypothetical protein [unclassified Pseudomonas]|uniref:hypothetical protein n=1 Tax=unclassified Pseudomonas TaxID=196821 RepID=UPI0017A8D7DA|nr:MULTISPECIES: hypothetical protein [unclassified Pseudomonas]